MLKKNSMKKRGQNENKISIHKSLILHNHKRISLSLEYNLILMSYQNIDNQEYYLIEILILFLFIFVYNNI